MLQVKKTNHRKVNLLCKFPKFSSRSKSKLEVEVVEVNKSTCKFKMLNKKARKLTSGKETEAIGPEGRDIRAHGSLWTLPSLRHAAQ